MAYKPGFPFSHSVSNLVKCYQCADGRWFGCDRGGAEVARRRVRDKIGRFSCRSVLVASDRKILRQDVQAFVGGSTHTE